MLTTIEKQEQMVKELSGSGETTEEKVYFMTFRHGMNPFCFKGFKHRGNLKSARDRAFKHGDIMGYKNIWVMPMVVDLETEELQKTYNGETRVSNPAFESLQKQHEAG